MKYLERIQRSSKPSNEIDLTEENMARYTTHQSTILEELSIERDLFYGNFYFDHSCIVFLNR